MSELPLDELLLGEEPFIELVPFVSLPNEVPLDELLLDEEPLVEPLSLVLLRKELLPRFEPFRDPVLLPDRTGGATISSN